MSKLLKALLFGLNFRFGIVEDGDGAEAVGTNNDARVAMLNAINDANDTLKADEYVAINDDGTTEPFVVQTPEGEQTPLENEAVEDAEAAEAIEHLARETDEQPEEPQRFKIRVNGQDLFLTQAELIERAQKVEAADQYLREAARLRNEQISKPQVSEPDPASVEDDDLALARAIQMGDEAQAVAAIRKLRTQGPSLTSDDISRTVDERLTFNDAINRFRTEYKDIVSDPVLNQLALDTDAKLLAAGDRRPYYERYKDIGDTLRAKLEDWTKQRTPQATREEKVERKASVSPVPKAAAAKTESSIQEEKEETVSDVIANIAKSRGGPQWMRSIPQ